MRVCDLTTLYLDGSESGVNTYLREKARHLADHPDRPRHVLIVPGRRTQRRSLLGSTLYTVRSPRAPGKPDHRILVDFERVREILRLERPTIVETDCVYFLGRVARSVLRERRTPLVGFYHVHLPTFIARPSVEGLGPFAMDLLERAAWRYVRFCSAPLDRILVASRDIHDRLAGAGFDRLSYVPLGVNLDLFRPPSPPRVANGTKVILHVGRLSPEKDQGLLIDAFRLLVRRGDYRLRIVGDGPARAQLVRRARGDDRIQFVGPLPYDDELARAYATADVLAQPSPNETFGLTVLEALASGVPVVAVGQGGPSDLVAPGFGELARPGDAQDLADKIERVASDRSRYRPGGSRADLWPWARTFDRLIEVYDEVLADPASPHGRAMAMPRPASDLYRTGESALLPWG